MTLAVTVALIEMFVKGTGVAMGVYLVWKKHK